jgi:transposase
MNTREIAKSVNKNVSTIQRWVNKAARKMQSIDGKMQSSTSTYPADYTLEETLAIIEAGMGKNAAGIFRANAEREPQARETLTQRDKELIAEIVSMTVSRTMERLDQRMATIENHYQQRAALLPAPQISDREKLNKIVRQYAKDQGISHSVVWGTLYSELYYRLNVNVRLRAENRNIPVIEYIDQEGLMPETLSIALEVFGV